MNISIVGLGKLGLPIALAISSVGHNVMGYDINPKVYDYIKNKKLPYRERGADELLKKTNLQISQSLTNIIEHGDIIFVPIQTPHEEHFEGITRLPSDRADFNYEHLKLGIKELSSEILEQGKEKIVIIISTVLPGTIDREIKPLINKYIKLCYNPFFIAMGTAIQDFLYPEFVLLGVDDDYAAEKTKEFYKTIHDKPILETSIKNAEAIKVAYNTFISTKICLINTWMEICEKIGGNVDEISRAFSLADERLISMKYLYGGAQDGGGCHPRDNIALSFLSRKLNLSYDWFENVALCRERQVEWLAKEMCKYNMPKVILGESFKKESNITVGSPSILLKNILEEWGHKVEIYDPYTRPKEWGHFTGVQSYTRPAVYLVSTPHKEFKDVVDKLNKNSIVLDIWRYLKQDNRVRYIGNPDD